MHRHLSALLLVAVTLPGLVRGAERQTLDTRPAQRIEAVLTFGERAPSFKAEKWLIYVAKLPELPSQAKVRTTVQPEALLVQDQSPLKREVFAVQIVPRLPEQQQKFRIQVKYQATLMSRRLVPLLDSEPAPPIKPLDLLTRRRALAASDTIDFRHKAFEKWLEKNKLKRQDKESEVEFAQRVLMAIRSQFTYAFYDHDRTAGRLADLKKTDCAGMSVLFVAACRANGIPARSLIGRLAESRDPAAAPNTAEHTRVHVRVEFFAETLGWVPAEPTLAITNKSRPVSQFVGTDPGDLLVQHIDAGFVMPSFKEPINGLQILAFAATGQGNLDGREDMQDWQVRKLPMEEEVATPAKPALETKKPADDPPKPDTEAQRKTEERAAANLRYARKLLANEETDKGLQRLRDILKEFPGTQAAGEARELLDKLSR
jgi:transglutaminase-like putative cysteine protease